MRASTPTTDVPAKLFRAEVLQARSPGLMGEILLTPRLPVTLLTIGAALMGIAVILFLVLGSYTRRATVTGQLLPSSGVIRVHTPQAGVVLEKHVAEGQSVGKGDVLYVLGSDRLGTGTREIQAEIGREVDDRRRSMEAELARDRAAETAEVTYLERRAATLRGEILAINGQLEQQAVRVRLADEARARYQGLADKDFVAREQLFQKEADLSEQQLRIQSLRRDALVAQRDLALALQEIANTRSRHASQQALLLRGISSSRQESTEVDARRRVYITAPEAGRATLVLVEVGQAVDPARPLLTVVPANARLEARLYAPSATVGFVRPGNTVQLRYPSFPYQKFGQQEGVVESVSNHAISGIELAGFAIPDTPAGEPVYAITVRLKDQQVAAYGKQWPLQAGMRLDADVLQETRRIYEWVLEPLYSITGRV